MKKKKGFTLPEAIITIAIIGVVAALVIPQLQLHAQEKELVSQYIKVHNALTNAYKETEAVEGYKLFGLEPDKFKLKLEEHLKLIDCEDTNYDKCMIDGSVYKYECEETQCNYIEVDINGDKKPNQIGKDRYKFRVTQNGLVSEGEKDICSGYDCGNYVISHHKIFDGLLDGCEEYGEDGRCSACDDRHKISNGLCQPYVLSDCETNESLVDGRCQELNCEKYEKLGVHECTEMSDNEKLVVDYEDLGFTTPIAGSSLTPKTIAQCNSIKASLGVSSCLSTNDYGQDYWLAGVEKCGGVNNMPSKNDLNNLDNLIMTNGKLDVDKAQALGFDVSKGYVSVWSKTIGSGSGTTNPYYRIYDSYGARSHFYDGSNGKDINGENYLGYRSNKHQVICKNQL